MEDNLFICGLNSQPISRIVLEGNKVVGAEWLLVNARQRFSDIAQRTDGCLYDVADGGRLYRTRK